MKKPLDMLTDAIIVIAYSRKGTKKMNQKYLTTYHSKSSYGLPVLVLEDGEAYGPDDTLQGGQEVGAMITTSTFAMGLDESNLELLRAWYSQSPMGDAWMEMILNRRSGHDFIDGYFAKS